MRRTLPTDRLTLLQTDPAAGLTEEETAKRRARFGTNRIAERPPHSGTALARDTARDPMIWFLLLTGLLFMMVGDYRDAWILAFAVVPLVGMDFFLHRRAEVSIEALGSVLASSALVIRQGEKRLISAEDLVPGDAILLEAGASFPVDGLILLSEGAKADESVLTGEAEPVGKAPVQTGWTAKPTGGSLSDENWAFAGARLLTGKAVMIAIFTGSDTLYGQIVQTAVAGPAGQTRLQKAVLGLVRILLGAALALCLLLAAVRLWQGFGLIDALMSAATLAVAAIPEEFPVVLTFSLAAGVVRLARRRALVRHAMAVENIGRVSIICTDKTGTITEGRLSLSSVTPAAGYSRADVLKSALMAAQSGAQDPLDDAIAAQAPPLDSSWSLRTSYPFTEGRRHEAAFWIGPREARIMLKGAAEDVIAMCKLSPDERQRWLAEVSKAASRAEKVIGCASQSLPSSPLAEPAGGYHFVGLLGFSDLLKSGAKEALARARQFGVRVVMVTGDHPETAAAIARMAGFPEDSKVMTGDQLTANSVSGAADIFARVSPIQKKQIVIALRQPGEVVAATGDGVNDVLALREADVSIAMGLTGTRSAREVADIVLLDDNLGTIIDAIAEGRQLFANLKRSFAFLLMIHIPLVCSAAVIPFFGYPLLYLPIHIVWLELLIHPASILAFADKSTEEPVPFPGSTFFSARDWAVIISTGTLVTGAVIYAFLSNLDRLGIEAARSSALVCLTAALGAVTLFLSRRSIVSMAIIALTWLSSSLLSIPGLADLLHAAPLPLGDWLLVFGIGVLGSMPALAKRNQ
ncbi:cation-translocating P-type ATPase [Allosphingosinicella vermicomposti]|uniref:cation-translocating P-type ATPase n=1 Tax=Allosphingosinicella vermicomposti TaxID=614671 RepID=UPI000D0E4DE7|nr:cation-transporting P-type ATPase [Allosphingosinicella vermicomposti]